MSGIIRVLLVDGDGATREGLSHMLGSEEGITVISEARSGKAALAKAKKLPPDVTIMLTSENMPQEAVIDGARAISQKLPTRVIIMAENPMQYVLSAIKAGAVCLLSNGISRDELLSAIRRINLWFPGPLSSSSTPLSRDTTL